MPRVPYEQCKELFVKAYTSGNWPESIIWVTQLLEYDENVPTLWINRGTAIQKMGHYLDAILNYERALTQGIDEEQRAIAYGNIGASYWDMFQPDKALKFLNLSLDLQPFPQIYMTMGNVYKWQGDLIKATKYYRKAVETDPEYADGHLVLGMALLKQGNLQEGFKEIEWRWKTDQLPARKLKCQQWKGEDLTNKKILVYGEQGLGDIIQFSRYASSLANRFPRAKIIVEGRPQLKRLLETLPDVYAVLNCGERLPEIDYAIPMLTLAGMLTPNIGAIPTNEPEFFLNHRDVEAWADRFAELPKGVKVGVCWAGLSRTHKECATVDRLRSAELSTFAALAKIPNIMWISLQQGHPAEQVKTPPSGMTIADFTEDMYDFYETCCAIQNCDLVISVDTSVVHAAASLGKPTWLLSRWDGCWRWFGDRPDSPWYPSLRQFVQPKPHDWAGMVKNVAEELNKFVSYKNAPELDLTLAK